MRRLSPLALALLLIVVGACSRAAAVGSIEVDLDDGILTPSAGSVRAGHVVFEAENFGLFPHTLVVTAEGGHVVASSSLIAPGATQKLELDLPPGTYQLTCRIVSQAEDGTLIDHFQLGMRAALSVES